MEAPWFERFFDETYLRSYASFFKTMDPEKDVEFLVRELRLEPGMRVLDLCCGQGRHAVPLARRGLRVAGLDLSAVLLEKAGEAAKAAGLTPDLVQGDMREIPWEGEFDAAVNLFTAFGYFEDDRENLRVLQGVARALKPGGRFAIDVVNYPWLLRSFRERDWSSGEGGLTCLHSRSLDLRRGILELDFTYIEKDGASRTIKSLLRLFMPHELLSWLGSAGLKPLGLFGDLAGKPYGIDSPRLVVVSCKEG